MNGNLQNLAEEWNEYQRKVGVSKMLMKEGLLLQAQSQRLKDLFIPRLVDLFYNLTGKLDNGACLICMEAHRIDIAAKKVFLAAVTRECGSVGIVITWVMRKNGLDCLVCDLNGMLRFEHR